MQHKYNSLMLNALLLLFITKACVADLMCYECTNCPKINNDTPKISCNAAYFENTGSTNGQQIQTTDVFSSTTGDSMMSTSTSATTSSSTKTSTTTVVGSTENMQSTTTLSESSTTLRTPPTPITVGPPQTTAGFPTPPNVTDDSKLPTVESTDVPTTVIPESDSNSESTGSQIVNALQSINVAYPGNAGFPANSGWQGNELPVTTPNSQSSEGPTEEQPDDSQQFLGRFRQRRDATNYQCYKVKRSVNGILITDRGCSRVVGKQQVCEKFEFEFGMESKMNKCATCTKSLCNGSNTIAASITLIFFGIIAAYLRLK